MLSLPRFARPLPLLHLAAVLATTVTLGATEQDAYLKASAPPHSGLFGTSSAIEGDTVVIGAPGRDNYTGAAYVFVRTGTTWSQQAVLEASNAGLGDSFGTSVAICGDTVVVGAPGEDSDATGVNGDEGDNSATFSGAAYVFVRNGTTWSQEAYLKATNTDWGDSYGKAVAISGEVIVVGAYGERSNTTGVNGNQSDNSAVRAGAAYVYVRTGTTWNYEAYLKASNTDAADRFGWGLALSGDTLVVGAFMEDSGAVGVNGDQASNGAVDSGAAYVFLRSGTTWSQQAYLKASNTDGDDHFGISVALSGDTVAVGAGWECSSATGVDGDANDNGAMRSGAAYVFERSGTTWSQQAYLKASNTEALDDFGWSVAVAGHVVIVGARDEDSSSPGVNGDQGDNSALGSGAAYQFVRNGTSWSQHSYLKASNTDAGDRFGWSAAAWGDTAVIGARSERSSATGVNGDQLDNGAYDAGAAYVFEVDGFPPGVPFCFGDQGSGTPCPCSNDNDGSLPGAGCDNGVFASGAKLAGSGTASVTDDTLRLSTRHLEPSNAGLYFQADNDLSPGVSWGDGLRCAGGNLKRLGVLFADANGYSDTSGLPLPISVTAGNVDAGDTKYYQCWYRTTVNPPCGLGVNDFNTSNGYSITWSP